MKKTRAIAVALVAMSFAAGSTLAAPMTSATQDRRSESSLMRMAQQAKSCRDICEEKRRACGQNYLVKSTAGGWVVSVEGHRLCGAEYRDCLKSC